MSIILPTIEMVRQYCDSRSIPQPYLTEFMSSVLPGGMLNKIAAIKFLRTYTGMGLKDAKDTVESVRGAESRIYSDSPARPLDVIEMKRLFSPIFEAYNMNIFTSEELQRPEVAEIVNKDVVELGTLIVKGIVAALESWKAMGFRNPVDACRAVLDNFDRRRGSNAPVA